MARQKDIFNIYVWSIWNKLHFNIKQCWVVNLKPILRYPIEFIISQTLKYAAVKFYFVILLFEFFYYTV